MRKYRLLFLILAQLAIVSNAQTLHSIIFANTECPGEKPGQDGIGPSVKVDFQRMSLEMTTIAKSIGYQLKKYYYYGSPQSFCRENMDAILQNFTCGPDDIVFFYYSGHGGRAQNQNSDIFPEMILKVRGNLEYHHLFPLQKVYKTLRDKSPRLTIVMGDLCNSIIKGFYRSESGTKGATVLSKGVCDVYKNLFLNVRGGLIAASSKPGETSGCCVYTKDGQDIQAGGYYTHSFLSVLQHFVQGNEDVSWDILMETVIDVTKQITSKGRQQVPIYKSELTRAYDTPSTTQPTMPQQPIASNDATTNVNDRIGYALSMVANCNVSLSDRIRNIASALREISASTRVQVVGYDNSTIVNTTTAEKYLNYLSIANNIDQVVVLDMDKGNSGQPQLIRVHEIHYK